MTYLRPTATRVALVALLGSLLVACLVVPAAAREYSIWEWWTDQAKTTDDVTPIHPEWGAAYAAWTPAMVMAQYVDQELWAMPPEYGLAGIKFEYAGNAPTNTFGWYDPGTLTKTEIFSGPDSYLTDPFPPGTSFNPSSNPFGFYLGAASGTKYSEDINNAGGLQWVKVFNDPRGASFGQILCWEDANTPTPEPFTADSLTYHAGGAPGFTEPDYNDLIVRVVPTPELSTVLLLGLSLVAVPVMFRRRRS